MKTNCWEIKKCGREAGGSKTDERGICPASQTSENDGKNGGKFSGRYCWKMENTLCDFCDTPMGSSMITCLQCDFLKRVKLEEGLNFVP